MIRKIKFQQLPKDPFAFACLELEQAIDSVLTANRQYYEKFRWDLNLKQLAFKNFLKQPLTGNIQHLALSGSVGAGKSTAPIAWFYEQMDAYPGTTILVMRRTHGQMIGSIYKQIMDFHSDYGIQIASCRESATPYAEIVYKNGSSWVFHSSQAVMENQGSSDTARGLGSTQYSGALLEEADMIHLAAVDTVPQRLRQKSGVPVRLIAYIYNPTDENHWIHKRFKLKDGIAPGTENDYWHMKFTMEDNRRNLAPNYIENMYALYRNKPALFRRMILGEPGPIIMGEPIYGGYFDRRIHVASESFIDNWAARKHWEDGPVCLCFDFGFRHPVMIVLQDAKVGKFQQLRVLAAFKGDHITLKPFTEFYLNVIKPLLPNAEYLTYGDPAGKNKDARGVTADDAFDVLKSLGLDPRSNKTKEEVGVDLIIDLLKKIEPHKVLGPQPAIVVDLNTCYTQDIIDMFEIGFCQNRESKGGKFDPVDDDNYIHFADAIRYGVTNRRSVKRHASNLPPAYHHGDRSEYMPLSQNGDGRWVSDEMTVSDLLLGGWDG